MEFREVRLAPLVAVTCCWNSLLGMIPSSRTVCPQPHQDRTGCLLLEDWPEHGHKHCGPARGRLGTEEGSRRYAPLGHKPGERPAPHSPCPTLAPAFLHPPFPLDATSGDQVLSPDTCCLLTLLQALLAPVLGTAVKSLRGLLPF